MKTEGINYVAADEGGLILTILHEGQEIKRRADDITDGAYWVNEYGLASRVLYSSTMILGTEHCFEKNDGPMDMWHESIDQAAWNRLYD